MIPKITLRAYAPNVNSMKNNQQSTNFTGKSEAMIYLSKGFNNLIEDLPLAEGPYQTRGVMNELVTLLKEAKESDLDLGDVIDVIKNETFGHTVPIKVWERIKTRAGI